MARLGLLIIIFAWLLQLNHSWKGRKELQTSFLLLQGLGIIFLVVSCFATGDALLGFLNLLSAGLAFRVYLKIKDK